MGFSEFDLKYLKDPKKVYGEKMTFITPFVKVSKRSSDIIKYFDKWKMNDEQLGTLMVELNKTKDPKKRRENGLKESSVSR